jgi:hypothetical protein
MAMHPTVLLAQARGNKCRWILTNCGDVDAGTYRRQIPGSGLVEKRKFARKSAAEVNLLDRLELAMTGKPARTSVCRELSDLNRRLGSTNEKAAARPSRSTSPRRRRQTAVESLPLFS